MKFKLGRHEIAMWERFRVPDVNNPERTYLDRWRIIETPWASVKLHAIRLHDSPARGAHDHPWSFVSIRLWGTYSESLYRRDGYFDRAEHRRLVTFRRAEQLHRITRLHRRAGVWTLVLCGPRRREWGFKKPGQPWVHWGDYDGPQGQGWRPTLANPVRNRGGIA